MMKGHVGGVYSVEFSPDGNRIAVVGKNKTVRIWDMATDFGNPIMERNVEGVCSVAFSPDGHRIATGTYDNSVQIWDATVSFEVLNMKGHKDYVLSVAFSPDGSRIVSGSHDSTIIIWDAILGFSLIVISKNSGQLQSVVFSLNGSCIISTLSDGTILYDAVSGCQHHTVTQSDDCQSDTAIIHLHGRTVKSVSGRTICELFHTINPACHAIHKTSLAIGTIYGHVFVINFPPALFTIADTHAVDEEERTLQDIYSRKSNTPEDGSDSENTDEWFSAAEDETDGSE
jgi:WD40 repeat protein